MDRTVSGFIVKKKDYNESIFLKTKDEYGFGDTVSRLIASRIDSEDELFKFLNPKIKYNLKNPEDLLDIESASHLFLQHIESSNRILIFGDYDVDGGSSAAILVNFLKEINHLNFETYIPNRFKDGYGFSLSAISSIELEKIDLIITLDCGTSSIKEIDFVKKKGVDVIVIDHHKSLDILPNTLIINPNRYDEKCSDDFKILSAAGVLFLFLSYFIRKNNYKINMMDYLDLVSVSTICDVMPLIKMNRSLVVNGLIDINKKKRKCFKIASEILGIENYTSYEIGFKIGPMINAGGRLGDSSLGLRFLTSESDSEISEIIDKLSNLNQDRSAIEFEIMNAIKSNEERIDDQILRYGLIFLFDKNWHEGVIGIIASRIKDIYHRPTMIGFEKDGMVKCSCRSINGIDIGSIILNENIKNLLINGGGHKMAGGISFKKENYSFLLESFSVQIKDESDKFQDLKEISYDGVISLSGISDVSFIKSIRILEPFGNGNEKPIFRLKNIQITKSEVLKDKHIKVTILNDGKYFNAISFNSHKTSIGDFLLGNKKCDLLVSVDTSNYNGREYISVQVIDCLKINL